MKRVINFMNKKLVPRLKGVTIILATTLGLDKIKADGSIGPSAEATICKEYEYTKMDMN